MKESYCLPRSFLMRALIAGFLRRLSESRPAAEMSEGNAGCLVFAVCASAERDETNAINKISVVLFIARPRGLTPARLLDGDSEDFCSGHATIVCRIIGREHWILICFECHDTEILNLLRNC